MTFDDNDDFHYPSILVCARPASSLLRGFVLRALALADRKVFRSRRKPEKFDLILELPIFVTDPCPYIYHPNFHPPHPRPHKTFEDDNGLSFLQRVCISIKKNLIKPSSGLRSRHEYFRSELEDRNQQSDIDNVSE